MPHDLFLSARRQLLLTGRAPTGPFGEIAANSDAPNAAEVAKA